MTDQKPNPTPDPSPNPWWLMFCLVQVVLGAIIISSHASAKLGYALSQKPRSKQTSGAPPAFTPPVVRPPRSVDIPTNTDSACSPLDIAGVSQLEDRYTSQFTDYLKLPESNSQGLSEICASLQAVDSSTGVRPAVIYATFVPPEVPEQGPANRPLISQETDQLELVMVTSYSDPIRKRVPGTTRKDIWDQVEDFNALVREPPEAGDDGTAVQAYGEQFYTWLIEEIEDDLTALEINNLVFIMDNRLRTLPLAAMVNPESGTYIIQDYSIGLMPSFTLAYSNYTDLRNAEVLAGGTATFLSGQAPLPAVPAELSVIEQLWSSSELLKGPEFTLNNVSSSRRDKPYGIVHLATHARFSTGENAEEEVDGSFIEFQDGQLFLNEIRNTFNLSKPPIKLLVLSACETALGNSKAELGFAGVASNAGALSALASIWKVDDQGTFHLMSEFYSSLTEVPIKAEALRQAQLALVGENNTPLTRVIENGQKIELSSGQQLPLPEIESELGTSPNLSHPHYWAGFTIVGNPW